MILTATQPGFDAAFAAATKNFLSGSLMIVPREDLSFLENPSAAYGGNGSGDKSLRAVLDKQAKFFPGGHSPTFLPGARDYPSGGS